jgi:ABC-type transport system involved in multi-copper enzyme maturation permease subunit
MKVASRIAGALDNPIIVMDGVSRMRTWRAPVAISLYLGLLGAFAYAVYAVIAQVQAAPTRGTSDLGTWVFGLTAFFQLSLVCLFAPALASGAISGERERQTFDMLLVSKVSAVGIVLGKLATSVGYMILLVLAALPLFAAVFLFGGIDAQQFVLTQALTVATAITLAAISVCVSAAFRRTLPATVTAYAVAFALLIGSVIFGYLFTLMVQTGNAMGSLSDVHPLLFCNPLYALFEVLLPGSGGGMALGRIVQLLLMLPGGQQGGGPLVQPWQASLIVELVVFVLTTWAAVHMVRGRRGPQARRPLPPPEEAKG